MAVSPHPGLLDRLHVLTRGRGFSWLGVFDLPSPGWIGTMCLTKGIGGHVSKMQEPEEHVTQKKAFFIGGSVLQWSKCVTVEEVCYSGGSWVQWASV